jgi:hypothetical protein
MSISQIALLLTVFASAPVSRTNATDQGNDISLRNYVAIRRFVADNGESLWRGLGAAPFDILLVGSTDERLYCRPATPDGFANDGTEPPSTIVMGSPQATGRSGADWTRTILHEHFHQWQDALPNFYGRVAALDLSGGDRTGMWMLNFAFPYAEPRANAAFNAAARGLAAAVDARGKAGFRGTLARYLAARNRLAATVGVRNWRYAELELWKEGVARWTEIELGKRFPDPEVQSSARKLQMQTRAWLDQPDLAGARREFVYPFGASEAMLLEACGPDWRRRYAGELALGPLLQHAARSCRPPATPRRQTP